MPHTGLQLPRFSDPPPPSAPTPMCTILRIPQSGRVRRAPAYLADAGRTILIRAQGFVGEERGAPLDSAH